MQILTLKDFEGDKKIPVICNSVKQEKSESVNRKMVHHQRTKAEDS